MYFRGSLNAFLENESSTLHIDSDEISFLFFHHHQHPQLIATKEIAPSARIRERKKPHKMHEELMGKRIRSQVDSTCSMLSGCSWMWKETTEAIWSFLRYFISHSRFLRCISWWWCEFETFRKRIELDQREETSVALCTCHVIQSKVECWCGQFWIIMQFSDR